MTGLSHRPPRSMGSSSGGAGARTGHRDVDREKDRDKKKWDSNCVVVICVEKWERKGERGSEKVRDTVWDEEREKEREPSWSKRLELRAPVVCARWCSLIIHCMWWMSLSPHTALLHSALCLSAPRGRDRSGERCIGLRSKQCLDVLKLYQIVSKRYTCKGAHGCFNLCMHVHLHKCMYKDDKDLYSGICLRLVIDHCWLVIRQH